MKKLAQVGVLALMAGLAVATARAEDHGISLASLKGSYGAKSSGFTTICANAGGCSAASPILLQKNFVATAQATVDDDGNFCGPATASDAPVAGSAAAANILTKNIVANVTSFDPATGQGDLNFSVYSGGSCNGASFDNAGATLLSTGTSHIVVSEGGNRIDSVVTSYVSVSGFIGSVVNSTTLHRQRRGEEHQ